MFRTAVCQRHRAESSTDRQQMAVGIRHPLLRHEDRGRGKEEQRWGSILVGGCKKPETPARKRVECTFR